MRGSRRFAWQRNQTTGNGPVHDISDGGSGAISIIPDLGRHTAMLPSRGLRPAQIAPLASRQSSILRSTATRKVRTPNGPIARFRAICPPVSCLAKPHGFVPTTTLLSPLELHLWRDFLFEILTVVAVLIASPHSWARFTIMSKPAPICTVEEGRSRHS